MTRMTQAALGVGCVAGGVSGVNAAQWSFAPQATLTVDDDNNRYLGLPAATTQSAFVIPSAVLEWSSETTQLSLSPWLMWQEISDTAYANVHSESLTGEYDWSGQVDQLSIQGGISDYTTLASDIPDTGLVAPGINRRTKQGALTFSHAHSERRSLIVQLSWLDLSYYGPNSDFYNVIAGYKYASVSLGEKFHVNEKTALTVSAFDNQLITPTSIGNSRESGLRLDFQHSFRERTSIKAFVGASQRSLEELRVRNEGLSLGATNSVAALGGFTLTWTTQRGHLDLDYVNTLQPYSAGVLAQRQSLTFSDTQSLSEKLDLMLSAARVQNNRSAVTAGIDRPYYDTASIGMNLHLSEAWRLHSEVGYTHTRALALGDGQSTQPLSEWRIALSLSWVPIPLVRTF